MGEKPNYKYLIECFTEQVIKSRYENMEKRAYEFITKSNLSGKVILNHEILNVVILDYFTDIERLKDFENIQHTNKNKISAYMAYWWLRRKPLQIIGDTLSNEELVYVNEKFVTLFLTKDFMYTDKQDDEAMILKNKKCKKCVEHIYYHLKYRDYTTKTLELMLMGIDTGVEIGSIINRNTESEM